MSLSKADIEYIASKTKLSTEKTILLTEEEKDLNLVLEQLVKEPLSKNELNPLSRLTAIKLIILRFSRETNFPLREKMYVATVINKHLPVIKRRESLQIIDDAPYEEMAGFCFVALGLAQETVNKDNENILDSAIENFDKANISNMSSHCVEWINILHNIKKQKIL